MPLYLKDKLVSGTGAPGKSAYEAAKAGGYTGTEAEFNHTLTNMSGHISSTDNPHSVTAAQIGALPDTTSIPTALSDLSDDAAHRVVTDEEKTAWNAKADAPFKPAGKSYLTFSSPNSFTLKVDDKKKHWDGTLEYFASDKTWSTWDGTTILSSVDNGGEYVLYLRGAGNTVITGNSISYKWVLAGSDIACIGNIENLLNYATVASGNHPTMARYCYSQMFHGCTSLTQAPALPTTTLADYCYFQMFYNCTALTQAPALPATTLADNCYSYMFYKCTSLTKAPALPATTLATYCYSYMFYGCTSLTQAPALPATTLESKCYAFMFSGCTSLKLSTTQTGEYTQKYHIPFSGNGTTATDALTDMFAATGGTFTGTPSINTTYYLSSDNMVVRETEVATLNGYISSIIDANSDVFIATYGTTTSAEIEEAYQAGKAIYCIKSGDPKIGVYGAHSSSDVHAFSAITAAAHTTWLCQNNTWSTVNNQYTPKSHASTHGSGGSDPITPSSIGAATSDHTHSNYATSSHNHAAGDITSGTLAVARGGTGQTTITPAVGTSALRAIYAGTSGMTAGSSSLTTGVIYLVYE